MGGLFDILVRFWNHSNPGTINYVCRSKQREPLMGAPTHILQLTSQTRNPPRRPSYHVVTVSNMYYIYYAVIEIGYAWWWYSCLTCISLNHREMKTYTSARVIDIDKTWDFIQDLSVVAWNGSYCNIKENSYIPCCIYVCCYPNVTNDNKWMLYCIVSYRILSYRFVSYRISLYLILL